jgi:hypothetical protein
MASTTTLPNTENNAFPLISNVPLWRVLYAGTAAQGGSRPALGTSPALVTLSWPDDSANTVTVVGSTEVFINWLRQIEQLLGG